jgi:exodeoxyribonuclease V alpha subunit
MTVHMSARLAWHMDGWNGHICSKPADNVYCVGPSSYPGEMIAENRNIDYERKHAGQPCAALTDPPPCVYSINAFGRQPITGYSEPPDFFKGGAKRETWRMEPSTIAIWPYEVMYGEDVKQGKGFDYDKRRENAEAYFEQFKNDKSLIFYYANFSNPLNQADEHRYVVVGVARLKTIAKLREYSQATEEIRQRYGGGFIWQRDVTSHYPEQGFRLPYHKFLDRPDVLDRFTVYPENPRLFKYATREISDDEALSLVERLLEVAKTLQDIGDDSEHWPERIRWLQRLIGELWENRGLYPGMSSVLSAMSLESMVEPWKRACLAGHEEEAKEEIFALLAGKRKTLAGATFGHEELEKLRRRWKLRSVDEQKLLRDILPRFDLESTQIERVLSNERLAFSVTATLAEIHSNPYVLAEQYVGDSEDDFISFSKIDHGMLPSPDLGGEPSCDVDDCHRLRCLLVERMRSEKQSTFASAQVQLDKINTRLDALPEWKKHRFSDRHLEVDRESLSEALEFRQDGDTTYLYWRPVFEDEREVEGLVRALEKRSDIQSRKPFTDKDWQNALFDDKSPLARKGRVEYEQAIAQQARVCQKVFARPLAVLCGAAGTGKTTVARSIIQAIERTQGRGASVTLLAPTGKAADRLRAATGREARTIHSFLAERGWMNENRTFKATGGKVEKATQTFIIDEASMLDLNVAATLVRAVHWDSVQRLILVGDPNQLPPIGRGKVFAELIDWLQSNQPESVGTLETNIRQMENRLSARGTGILDTASLYLRKGIAAEDGEEDKAAAEDVLKRIQAGGEVDKDLRVLYWNNPEELEQQLLEVIVKDMEEDSGTKADAEKPWELWKAAFEVKRPGEKWSQKDPEYSQILTPYRGELFGTDALNGVVQRHARGIRTGSGTDAYRLSLDGIMLSDKVIQIRNRTKSDPLYAFDPGRGQSVPVEVFNGELGFVRPHGFDAKKMGWSGFRVERFQVQFARKENLWVGYGSDLGRNDKGRWIKKQSVEDNLELAYAISVHKAQGSEFRRVYLVVPKHKRTLLSPELFYTGLTRARIHCTLLIEEDIAPLLDMRRREASHLLRINSSLFEFKPLPTEVVARTDWYEEGKIYKTLVEAMVRSKSEVIIANLLANAGLAFTYETALFAPDGTFYLPDFTIKWRGETYYWEHWGLKTKRYQNHKADKQKWYARFFPGQLLETLEAPDLTEQAKQVLLRLGVNVPT